MHDLRKIHEKYGEAVRIAPDEVSFATPDAWHDVYATRSGRNPFEKNPMWYKPPPNQAWALNNTPDPVAHARMLGILNEAFTEKALQNQESIVQFYVDLLISRLRERASSDINVVDWFNYMTFDVIGDLAFGESFNSLKNSVYHPWVSMIFDSLKMYSLAAATRYYPLVEKVSMMLLPTSLERRARDHHQLCVVKTHRRLNMEKQRYDFMTPIIESNTNMDKMSLSEIESTMSMMIVAGSETTSTTLSGITYQLTKNPSVMQNLVSEVRDTFQEEKDITMHSVRTLPYLNAVISEGLRVCNPVPAGLPRLVPPEGDTVCGLWLPGKVSSTLASLTDSQSLLTYPLLYRRMSPSTPTQFPILLIAFTGLNPSFQSVGFHLRLAQRNTLQISSQLCNLSALVLGDVWGEG